MLRETLWMLKNPIRRAFSPRRTLSSWRKDFELWHRFWQSYQGYQKLDTLDNSDQQHLIQYLFPCLGEDTAETEIEPTYFYQDAWAFEKIVKQQPTHHIDIGSHHKFVAFLSKVVPLTMVDIRPLSLPLESLSFKQGSILELPFASNSIESISSLCVVEHIGLGRYGDPLDTQGTEKAIAELKRVVKPDGNLYLSLPIDDKNRIYFNAHRAFSEEYAFQLFYPFSVVEARYIYDRKFVEHKQSGFGIGCYHLKHPGLP
jgi:SAM-dependent methyltransferase